MHTRVVKRRAGNTDTVSCESESRSRRKPRIGETNVECETGQTDKGCLKRACRATLHSSTSRITHNQDDCVFSNTRVRGKRKRLADERTVISMAITIVVRFMRKFATPLRTMRALAIATLPPSSTGASKQMSTMLGHQLYMVRALRPLTIRAMQRFIRRTGLFRAMKSDSAHLSVFASRILRCFDVCGCPMSYRPNGKCVSVEHSAQVFSDLLQSAVGLNYVFMAAQKRVLDYTWPTTVYGGGEEKLSLCTHLCKFDNALSAWRKDTSFELQDRTKNVLFNIYDTVALLRVGVRHAEMSCVPKPFLQARVCHYELEARKVEKKFLKVTSMFNGRDMLEKMKVSYHDKYTRGTSNIVCVSQTTPSTCSSGPLSRVHANTTDHTAMKDILYSLRSFDTYTSEEVHHESILEASFHIKHPHLGRDDVYIQGAVKLYTQGQLDNLRTQMRGDDMHEGVPVYRHAILAIARLRDHLAELHVHSHRDKIFSWLDDRKLKRHLGIGTLTWSYIISMLHMSVYAMRYCIGTDVARDVLYKARSRDAVKKSNSNTISNSIYSCTDAQRVLITRPRSYVRLMKKTSNVPSCGNGEDGSMFDQHGDSNHFALDRATFMLLKRRINAISDANNTHTTAELGTLFCDTLACITEELCKLDVSLANADINASRSCSLSSLVATEQASVSRWFKHPSGMQNTVAWLKQHGGGSMKQRVFRGYMSLIMGEKSLALDEIHYPEVVALDIPYIHKARGAFYGKVAQATVLVILGQRLTDAGVSNVCINSCLSLLASETAFIKFGTPEVCRCSKEMQDSLQEATRGAINTTFPRWEGSLGLNVGCVSDTKRDLIICEIARETTHYGYPTTPVASSIARKWTTAASMAVPDERGHLPPVFASPEATRAGFASRLMLPRAVLCLSRDFHFNSIALVQRVTFNIAVHGERYREISRELASLPL